MECSFWTGQKVVCIADRYAALKDPSKVATWPRMGEIYTIRGMGAYTNGIGLYLVEILNPPRQFLEGVVEPSFHAANFRPVKETKTDISALESILKHRNVKDLTFSDTPADA